MEKADVIVIGASAGGVHALTDLLKHLPKDLEASIFIVLHLPPFHKSHLPDILRRHTKMRVIHPDDGVNIELNTIYIARPDHHMLVEKGRVLIKRGPKENRFRPSIDALFRSAAYEYGSRVIGIVLSGLMDDGTSGMWTIKRFGGTTIIQDPATALHSGMPQSVIQYVEIDYQLPAEEIGTVLAELCKTEPGKQSDLTPEELSRIAKEIKIAAEQNAFDMGILESGKPTHLTCPECNGSLVEIAEGNAKRYRCHTGHSFGLEPLLEDVTKAIEEDLWKAIKGLEESIILFEELAKQFDQMGATKQAAESYRTVEAIRKRSRELHRNVFDYQQNILPLVPSGLEEEKAED